MASSTFFKLLCVGLLALLVLAPHAGATIGCGQVYGGLSPCVGYINGQPFTNNCCTGIKKLYSQVQTKADRQSVCGCLKSLSATFKSKIGKAQEVLNRCHVSLPYPLNPNIDCTKVN